MMDLATKLKLQSWLDGEIEAAEKAQLDALAASDIDARNLVGQLKSANQAFHQFADSTKVPMPRELYWSAIERQITKAEAPAPEGAATEPAWLFWLRKLLVPATTAALLLFAGWFASVQFGLVDRPTGGATTLEGSMSSTGNFTYRDFTSGTTLVWLSFPAENEIASYGGDFTLP